MYYKELEALIRAVLNKTMSISEISKCIMSDFDCLSIYESEDQLVTDAFFALKHFVSGEENIREIEWIYFIKCFEGQCEYNLEQKMKFLADS